MACLEERQPTAPQAARRSIGCVFGNADDTSASRAIDAAGRKGLHIGGTAVCQRHTNLILKTGKASTTDVHALIELAATRTHHSGLQLQPEIDFLGSFQSTLEQPPRFHHEKGAASR